MITYDEDKRRANLRKHGLDFAGADTIFDHPVVSVEDDRESYGEKRINVLGFLDGEIVFLTYTERGEDFRAISLRKATRHEIRHYAKSISC
ncbi:MAG: BrnT family toxin [Betaproteobacteria bacterium]|nr:BrnT family toxin [Betaproteobacteria bacterium]